MWSSSTIPNADRGASVEHPPRGLVGIMGGTFDPVHNGHLAAAAQLGQIAGLDQIWLMPNAMPPHRSAAPVASADDRMRMVELATAGLAGLVPSRVEVERGGISYTIDTVRQLTHDHPGQRFAFLLGSDAALQIRSWHEADALLDEASFIIFNRPETALAPQTLYELGFRPAQSRIVHLDTPAIAAHQVRDRLARGASIDDLVPAVVADYIRTHDLYRASPGVERRA
jgi:nicotinate-nucleotide adenylyltransferase